MKYIYLTLVLLLTVSFAFANDTKQSELSNIFVTSYDSNSINLTGTCTVRVSVYDGFGNYTGFDTYTFENVASESDCYYIAKFVTFANS